MKKMMLSACLLAAFPALAQQDLAYKIPQQARAVVTVRGSKLLELLSASEYNNTEVGRKMIKELSRKEGRGKIAGVEDLGIDLSGNVYYYNMQTDSVSYNGLLFPLNDVTKFERLFDNREKITREGDTRISRSSDDVVLTWNNNMASFVFGELKQQFFNDSTHAARYGIKDEAYGAYNTYEVAADTIVAAVDSAAADVVAEPVVEVPPPIEEATTSAERVEAPPVAEETVAAEIVEAPPVAEPSRLDDVPMLEDIPPDAPPPPMVVESPPLVAVEAPPAERYDYRDQERDRIYNDNWEIKRKLRKAWIGDFARGVFARREADPSVRNKPAFLAAQDKNASASLYLDDVANFYRDLFSFFSYRYFGSALSSLNGFKGLNAQLYFNKENVRLTSTLILDDEKAASYKKLYDHKLNSKFTKYVNSDKMIGFVSYSLNTEEYLKQLPAMMSYAYGGYMSKYTEELNIASEALSIMLDEKAIAKVIKGDALLMVTDIAQKEYTYKTYEYNDDWEKKEVKRTKKETLPEFLFMFSSDDSHIITRLLNYGIRKGAIKEKAGIYTLDRDVTKSPLNVHLLIKDGIVFIGTSYKDIENISLDRFQGNISKEQKTLLMKNNMAVFFDPKKLAGKIPLEEFRSNRKLNLFNNWMNSTGKFYGRSTGIKGNTISAEMIAEVPQGRENALKYIFALIDSAAKMD